MKQICKLTIIVMLAGMVIYSCRPEKIKDIGSQKEVVPSLIGTWKLTKVVQTDEDAKSKGFTYGAVNIQQKDLTNVFPYSDFKLTLNGNGTTPTTFTATPGNAPKIIQLTSGNWVLDDPKYPKQIALANGTDTAKITLGTYPSEGAPVLKVRLERRDASTNKLLISYSYEFSKQ
jgi:hypothetical protein